MEVILAKKAGFCFGVKRAVDTAFTEAKKAREKGLTVYTFGDIIHNEIVINDLKKEGVGVINSTKELASIPKSVIIIRSHGVGREVYQEIEKYILFLLEF